MNDFQNKTYEIQLGPKDWFKVCMMALGIFDFQMNQGIRILHLSEVLLLYQIGGKIHRPNMSTAPSRCMLSVPLEETERGVLLKVISWYEDNLLEWSEQLEKQYGSSSLIARYGQLTQIRRAVQTAPQISSDQYDR